MTPSNRKFYDVSPASEARFITALRRSHTLEGYLEEHIEHVLAQERKRGG